MREGRSKERWGDGGREGGRGEKKEEGSVGERGGKRE